MRIAIFDYGAGNLHSLTTAIAAPDRTIEIEADPMRCIEADVLVLPGVGAFAPAAARLAPARDAMRAAILDGLPVIGVCLGMQLLFDRSDEGSGAGLGILEGPVTRLNAERVPHIGWNTLDDATDPLVHAAGFTTAYYANGYACRPEDEGVVTAWTTHESDRFAAIVRRHRVIGVQFHPEKSSSAGVQLLQAALAECAR